VSATLTEGPADAAVRDRNDGSRLAARRAVVRWAWRLFRREWRQQLLVFALIVVAVGATVVGATVATNSPAPAALEFGNAQDLATFNLAPSKGTGTNLANVTRQIGSLEHRFGRVDVIENQSIAIPGSISTFDLRAQSATGPYGGPMLSLVSGHYPTGPGQVALTAGVASAFSITTGEDWHERGATWHVVGIVEDPQSLLDEFALVAPGQVTAPTQVTVLFDAHGVAPSAIGPNVQSRSSVAPNALNPETISLAGVTIGMLLIALVSVGGFTALAQRRLRSLGMLGAIGATDKNVSLVVRANGAVVGVVGALTGAVLGFVLWVAYRPHLESSSHHIIGLLALPWLVVALAVVLAVVATYFAASRPARSITKVSIVAALSGRPAPPKQVHRSAVPGIVFLVIAFFLLGYSGSTSGGSGSGGSPELVLGLVALFPAVILLAPFCLSVLARLGRRAPIAVRMALRDLARYRARSGSALAAISIGVLIAVVIAILASARYGNSLDYAGPNMTSNQLIVYTPDGQGGTGGSGSLTTSQVQAMSKSAHDIASSLGTQNVVELDQPDASLNYASARSGRNWNGAIYVGTPSLLRAFGIDPAQIDPNADVLTMRPGISGLSGMQLVYNGDGKGSSQTITPGQGGSNGSHHATAQSCPPYAGNCLNNPVIQQVGALPSGTSAPNTVVTEHAIHQLALSTFTGGWLIQGTQPFSAAQIHTTQQAAAAAGLTLESKNDQPTSSQVINWATAFGIALALAILAMGVGLIRSETASNLRTLAATGASSYTRRSLTAATAGALGLLGALLGTLAGYVGVIGWIRSNSLNGGIAALGNVPVGNLLVILIGMPLVAAAIAWLLSGREPGAMGRQPIE
jgi:putative ABC transport system permease protein